MSDRRSPLVSDPAPSSGTPQGAIALLFVIIAVSSGGNSGSTSTATDPAASAAGANAPAAAEGVTYEVTTSDGKGTALVTYTSDKNFNQSQENGAKLPWRKTV